MSEDIRNKVSVSFDLLLKEQFGLFLTRGEVEVIRRASGPRWVSRVYVVGFEDLEVGTIEADQYGTIVAQPSPEDVVEAIKQWAQSSMMQEPDPFADLGDELSSLMDDEDAPATTGAILQRIEELIKAGDKEAISQALELYPILLESWDSKAPILKQMGKLSLAIGNPEEGIMYLEAAAQEYALRGDLEALDDLADSLMKLAGQDAYLNSKLKIIVEGTKQSARPIHSFAKLPMLRGLSQGMIQDLEFETEEVEFAPGDDITVEGEPADHAFFVRTGLIHVVITEGDRERVVRTCFPGEFLGESAVVPGARRTATLRAITPVSVWRIPGDRLKMLMDQYDELAHRLTLTKYYHSIDSFLFAHPSLGVLDVDTRAEFVSLLRSVDTVAEGTVLLPKGTLPDSVYLVLEGRLGFAGAEFGADTFVPMSDALHRIETDSDVVALEESRVAVFDGEGLHNLAVKSPPEVVAALERANG